MTILNDSVCCAFSNVILSSLLNLFFFIDSKRITPRLIAPLSSSSRIPTTLRGSIVSSRELACSRVIAGSRVMAPILNFFVSSVRHAHLFSFWTDALPLQSPRQCLDSRPRSLCRKRALVFQMLGWRSVVPMEENLEQAHHQYEHISSRASFRPTRTFRCIAPERGVPELDASLCALFGCLSQAG